MHFKFSFFNDDPIKLSRKNCGDAFWDSVLQSIEPPKISDQTKKKKPSPAPSDARVSPTSQRAIHQKRMQTAIANEGSGAKDQSVETPPSQIHHLSPANLIIAQALLGPPPSFVSLRL